MSSTPSFSMFSLARALKRYQLPAPVHIEVIEKNALELVYRLHFENARVSTLLLKRVLQSTGRDTRTTEYAALKLIADIPELPTTEEFHILRQPEVGFPGALLSDNLHPRANQFQPKTERANRSARFMGGIRATLDQHVFDQPALFAEGELGFVPKGTWTEQWSAFVQLWTEQIHRTNTDLGHIASALEERIQSRQTTLEQVQRFTLVHLDLTAKNVSVSPEGQHAVHNWGGALIGDPLVDWLQPLMADDAWLLHFVQGYGVHSAQELLNPSVIARIELYLFTHCLARLAVAGLIPNEPSNPQRRAYVLEWVRRHCEWMLTPGFIAHRIQVALQQPTTTPDACTTPSRQDILSRHALMRYSGLPRPIDIDANLISTCLAIALSNSCTDQTLNVANKLATQIEPALSPHPTRPISNREEWKQNLIQKTLLEASDDRFSSVMLWLGVLALEALEDTVSDRTLIGLETSVSFRVQHEARSQTPRRTRKAFTGALVSYLLALRLPDEGLKDRFKDELFEIWDSLVPVVPTLEKTPDLPRLQDWLSPQWVPGGEDEAQLPVLLLALHHWECPPLSADPKQIWHGLTFGSSK